MAPAQSKSGKTVSATNLYLIRMGGLISSVYSIRSTARYIGSMVADVHNVLINGGIYGYPRTLGNKEGKLRLLYESAPMAMIMEQAGGAGSTGSRRILDVKPKETHQR
jgi:fructose-1,6-bisphosphatase I